ncbi:MAG: FliH/SctL family protein [Acidobacteriota bacterium]
MKTAPQAIESYKYSASSAPPLPEWLTGDAGSAEPEADTAPRIDALELERRIAAEAERSFAAGLSRGAQETRAITQRETEERLRRELAGLIESFAVERDRYLRAVEEEVVRLALAIASRILRREAEMDPLLLTGAVRVALGQLAASTRVKLRVPAAQKDMWSEAVALLPNLPLQPEIAADETMRIGDCVVETELGSVDIGVRAQLREIERGFFDGQPRAAEQPA